MTFDVQNNGAPFSFSVILRPTIAPWLAAGFISLFVVLPPGLYGGINSAPLDSYFGILTIVTAWLLAWAASAFVYPRLAYIFSLGLPLTFFVLKLLGVALIPATGIEARVTSPDPALQAPAVASPFRPVGPGGWPLYRSPVIPPHFVNDIRRFDDPAVGSNARDAIPFNAMLRGSVKVASGTVLLADHRLTDVRITTAPVQGGMSFEFEARGRAVDFVCRPLFRLDIPGAHSHKPLYFPEDPGRSGHVVRLGEMLGSQTLMGWLLIAFSAIAVAMVPSGQGLRRKVIAGALPLLAIAGAALVPISVQGGVAGIIPRGALAALCFIGLAVVIARHWNQLSPAHHRAWHALLLFAWCLVTLRFYVDRYPSGFAILGGGSDSLFHYTFASEILRGDWLHQADAPFSRQFGMRYILAALMAVLGEGPVYAIYVNTIAYGVIGLLVASILRESGARLWALAPVIWIGLILVSPFKMWVPTLFPEVMSILLLLAAIDQLCKWHYRGRTSSWRVAAGAIWLSLAIYTRNNYLLIAPVAALLILLNPSGLMPARQWRWATTILFAIIVIGMIGAVAVRNTTLARPGEPFALLLSKNVSDLALYQGFHPAFIGDEALEHKYGHLSMKSQFFATLKERPGLYLRYVADRIAVLVGGPAFTEPNLVAQYPRFNPINLLLFVGAFVVGGLRLFRRRWPDFLELVSWLIILPQVALVVFMIGYVGEGYRFLLPCYPFLIILLAREAGGWGKNRLHG